MPDRVEDPLAPGDAGAKVIRGGGLRAAAHVAGVAGGLLSAPLVVRHLGIADFGRYATVTAIVTMAVALTEGGLANVAVRRLATSDAADQRAIVANLLGLRVALSLLAGAGAVAFGVLAGHDAVVVGGLALGAVAILGNNLWGVGTTVLTARLELATVALIDLVRSTATTLLLLALVVAGTGLGAFYGVAPAAALLTLALTAWLLRGKAPMRPRARRREWGSLLRETAAYAAATALGAAYFQVALVSTSVLADEHETGIFGVGFRIVEIANGVPWLLAASVFPVLARAAAGDAERLRYATARATEACLAVGGLAAVGLVIGAEVAVDVVGGAEAAEAVGVLRLLGIGAMATYFVAAWSFVLLSLQRYRALVLINGLGLAAAIGLSVALIPPFGAEGAAIVTIALEVGLATGYAIAIRVHHPELGPRAGNLGAAAVALAAGLGTGAALLAVAPLAAALAAVLVYCGVLLLLRGVPEEVRDALRGPLASRGA